MVSERLMVERRWAIEMVVLLPFKSAERAELTSVSDSASKADVAIDERFSKLKFLSRMWGFSSNLRLGSRYQGS